MQFLLEVSDGSMNNVVRRSAVVLEKGWSILKDFYDDNYIKLLFVKPRIKAVMEMFVCGMKFLKVIILGNNQTICVDKRELFFF